PLNGHINGGMTVHFQKKSEMLGNCCMSAAFNSFGIKSENQFKIVVTQVVLIVVFKCSLKKYFFLLNITELVNQSFGNGTAFAHVFKGFQKNPVKIPVDKVVLVLKIPVESLTCCTTLLNDLADSNF